MGRVETTIKSIYSPPPSLGSSPCPCGSTNAKCKRMFRCWETEVRDMYALSPCFVESARPWRVWREGGGHLRGGRDTAAGANRTRLARPVRHVTSPRQPPGRHWQRLEPVRQPCGRAGEGHTHAHRRAWTEHLHAGCFTYGGWGAICCAATYISAPSLKCNAFCRCVQSHASGQDLGPEQDRHWLRVRAHPPQARDSACGEGAGKAGSGTAHTREVARHAAILHQPRRHYGALLHRLAAWAKQQQQQHARMCVRACTISSHDWAFEWQTLCCSQHVL